MERVQKKEEQKDAKGMSTMQMARVVGNQAVVQRMLGGMKTRFQEKMGYGEHSREYREVDRLLRGGPYGRTEIYSRCYYENPLPSGAVCSKTGCTALADTWDHRTPLASLFNDSWPDSISHSTRQKQYSDQSNLQPMCRVHNSAKGSGHREYDQRCATACMVFAALGESMDYYEVLTEYGWERATSEAVLRLVSDNTERR